MIIGYVPQGCFTHRIKLESKDGSYKNEFTVAGMWMFPRFVSIPDKGELTLTVSYLKWFKFVVIDKVTFHVEDIINKPDNFVLFYTDGLVFKPTIWFLNLYDRKYFNMK